MDQQEQTSVTKFQIFVYAFYGVMQSLSFRVPMNYGQMYMTQYLGVPIATATLVLTIAKTADFFVSCIAGGIIQSANLKKGKFLPWMKVLRFVIAAGAIMQMSPIQNLPVGAKVAIVGLGYIMMHGSMNFMVTCQRGLMPYLCGSNMDDRVKLTTRQAQVNSASSVILAFGTLPLITFVGKLAGDPAKGYSYVSFLLAPLVIIGVALLGKGVGHLDKPRDPNLPPPKKITAKDMVTAIFTNDQMVLYMIYQIINGCGTYVVSGMRMYYWSIVMNSMGKYALVSGISTCAGFVFALFVPKIGKKIGKRNSILVNFGIMALSKVIMATMSLKSIWWMAAATMLASAGMYLTTAFGVNYYLDIGEYGYYKTGKDFRTLSMSMQNIPQKISTALGGAIGGVVLARMNFDKFQGLYAAANKLGDAGDWSFMATDEFTQFCSKFIKIYSYLPLVFSGVAIVIFFFGYKIKDEDAKFYASENSKRAAAARAAAAAQAEKSEEKK